MAENGKAQIILSAEDKTKAAFESAKRNLTELSEKASGIGANFGTLGIALASAFEAATLKEIINIGDELNKLSQKTGITVDALSALKYAGSLADVGIDDLANGIKHLGNNMAEAAGGSKDAQAIFKALGIAFTNANGSLRSTDQVLGDVADKFASYADGAAKGADATALFGKNGTALIPLLNQGRKGIEEARKEAEQFGIVMGPEFAKQAEEFNDNLTRISAAAKATKISLASELLPSIVDLTNELVEGRKVFGSYLDAIIALGVKRPAFESYGQGANAAHKEVELLTEQLARLNGETAKAEETAGGAALVGPRQRGGAGAKSALMQRLEEAKKVEAYFTSLNTKKIADQSKELEDAFFGGPPVKRGAPTVDKTGGGKAKAEKPLFVGPDVPEGLKEALKAIQDTDVAKLQRSNDAIAELNSVMATGALSTREYEQALKKLAGVTGEAGPPTDRVEAFRQAELLAQKAGEVPEKFKEMTDEVSEFAKQAARNIQDTLGSSVEEVLGGHFDNIGQMWVNLLKKMAAQAIAADLSKELFGLNFGKTGELGGIAGDVWSGFKTFLSGGLGFRATGGPVAAGMPYVVGERGPELFMPETRGDIVPAGNWGGSGPVINSSPNIYVDSSTDAARIGSMVTQALQAYDRDLHQRLRAAGVV